MSITNAISAIAVVGSIIVTGADYPPAIRLLGAHRPVRLDDEHRQRVSHHRPHAEDVQDRHPPGPRVASHESLVRAAGLHRRHGPLRLRAALDERAGHRPARRLRRRGGDDARDRGHLGPARGGTPRLDRPGAGGRRGGRRAALPRAAHRGAAADRAVACVRRARGRAGRHGQVLPLAGRGAGEPDGLPDGGDHRRGHPGVSHLHRQPHGGRQAAGSEMDPAAAGHLPAAEPDQPPAAGRRGGGGRGPGAQSDGVVGGVGLPGHHRPRPAVRRAPDHPDRRRRHADRDRNPQRLRRPLRRGHGVRARQQAPDHRGRARRLQRPHPGRSSCARR